MAKKAALVLCWFIVGHLYSQTPFSPADLGGLELWLKADTGVVLSGSLVSQWTDFSGNDRHAANDLDIIRPMFQDSAINNLPVISFDGTDDFLVFPEVSNLRTAFWVLRENALAGASPTRGLLGYSGALNFFRGTNKEFWNAEFSHIGVRTGATRLNFQDINGTQTVVPNDYSIVSLVTTENVQATHLTMELNVFGWTWWGEMAEVILFSDSLTDQQILQVENYLANKYGPAYAAIPDINVEYGFCDTTVCASSGFLAYQWSNGATAQCTSFDHSGTYFLQATDYFGRIVHDTLDISFPGNLQITNDTICQGNSFVWNTNLNAADYTFLWSNNSNEPNIELSNEDNYVLQITDSLGCEFSIDFTISVDSFPSQVSLGNDLQLCAGNTIQPLQPQSPEVNYLWSTEESTWQIEINQSGAYRIEATNITGCIARDTINVLVLGTAPQLSLSASTLCAASDAALQGINISGENISSWQWTVNDAVAGNTQNINYTFPTPGEFLVAVEVLADNGCSGAFDTVLVVLIPPSPSFSTSLLCDNILVYFSDESISEVSQITTWNWLIDGTAFTGAELTTQFAEAGFVNVQFSVADEQGCSAQLSQFLEVHATPEIFFAQEGICQGELTEFNEGIDESLTGPITSYHWNFGDNTSSTLANPTHFFALAGTYPVELTAIAASGCKDSLTQDVQIILPPNADFVIANACVGQLFELQDASVFSFNDPIATWEWTVDEINILNGDSVEFIFDSPGFHSVQLVLTTTAGCTADVSQQIPVWINPVAAFSFTPEIGAAPFEVQFSNTSLFADGFNWNFGDGNSSNELSPVHIFQNNGNYEVELIVYSVMGCSDSTQQNLQVASPLPDVLVQDAACNALPAGQQITARIVNNGNITISNLVLSWQTGNEAEVAELWSGQLLPGAFFDYTFTSLQTTGGNQFPYLCVKAEISNQNFVEPNKENNSFCKALEENGLELFPAYPNPNDGKMFVRFNTGIAGDLVLKIFDASGKMVRDLVDHQVPKGFHQYFLDVSDLEMGNYSLVLEMGGSRSVTAIQVKEKN
jgi:PKD repeat protein